MPVRLLQTEASAQLTIEYRSIGGVVPYARNSRTHSEAQVALIAGSMREYGWTSPILVDGENGIIAGHGRVLAARKLGLASVPVIELAHLSESQKRAYVLADNRLSEQAGWDRELLALEVADLADLGIDLATLGFEAAELDALLDHHAPGPREEGTPEPPAVPISQANDLWLLGPHRLLCGSSTDPDDVERLLGRVRPHLMACDPPFGVRYDPAWRNRAGLSATQRQAIEAYAAQPGASLIARFTEVESGRNADRPQLKRALHLAKVTGATLVIAKLDRLSRNAAFLLTLRDSGVRFSAVDLPEANDLTVGIMALVAQQEREAISRRTKEALSVARSRGVKLGNPNGAAALRRAGKGGAPLREAIARNADRHAQDLAPVVEDIRACGAVSLRAIAAELNGRGMLTRRSGRWHVSTVTNLLDRLGLREAECASPG